MKTKLFLTMLIVGLAANGQGKESKRPDAQAVDSACTQEAATAGCGNEKVGTGLLKCLHAYKKANASFKFSDSCKAAMKTFRVDRKEAKDKK